MQAAILDVTDLNRCPRASIVATPKCMDHAAYRQPDAGDSAVSALLRTSGAGSAVNRLHGALLNETEDIEMDVTHLTALRRELHSNPSWGLKNIRRRNEWQAFKRTWS